MDILKPQLVVIEGRQYRKLPVREPTNSLPAFHGITDSEDLYPDNETDPQSVEEVVPVENGYLLKMDIPSVFYKYIIGKGGAVKRDIERDTDCSIHIPRQGEVGLVEIFGRTTSNVCRAKVQLELKMEVRRGREMYTHFAGILLNAGEISENLKTFSEECLARHSKAMGVCPEVLQIPTKFHITIGMMKLFSQKEKDEAKKLLEDVVHRIVKPLLQSRPLVVCVKGLEIMRDDPKSTHVLYAKVQDRDGSDRLQRIIDSVAKEFVDAGLMEKSFDRDSVKIHATVMNSKWKSEREGPKPEGGKWKKKRNDDEAIDVRSILSEFKEYSFGVMQLSSLHILTRGQYEEDKSYHVLSEAAFS